MRKCEQLMQKARGMHTGFARFHNSWGRTSQGAAAVGSHKLQLRRLPTSTHERGDQACRVWGSFLGFLKSVAKSEKEAPISSSGQIVTK